MPATTPDIEEQASDLTCALVDSAGGLGEGMPVDAVLGCFLTAMRGLAFASGTSAEDFDALLRAAIRDNPDWWRAAFDAQCMTGEA